MGGHGYPPHVEALFAGPHIYALEILFYYCSKAFILYFACQVGLSTMRQAACIRTDSKTLAMADSLSGGIHELLSAFESDRILNYLSHRQVIT